MIRLSVSRGTEDVASRISRRRGCSVISPSTAVHSGVIVVIPCTRSNRPPGVESVITRLPKSSNGVADRMFPTLDKRRPLSGTRWKILISSIARPESSSAAPMTRFFETNVRVNPLSHITTVDPAPSSACGSILIPGSRAIVPFRIRPSSRDTRSA